ncbi:hypothetical protein G5V59_00935 [Nocardioides sp. W3-2-3]|nr:hypothetical protein [Nocardioides convexus]
MLGLIDVADVGFALARLTDATLEAALDVTTRAICRQRGLEEAPTRIAVVAMGRYGGFESSYGSDADVLFVHDPLPGVDGHEAATFARLVAEEPAQGARRARPGPGAGRRRGPAPGGPAGPAGAHARRLRRLLRQVVARVGGPGPAPRGRSGGRPGPARALHGADRPAALPRGRAQRGRRAGGAPDQGPRRQGAAAPGCRPDAAPQGSAVGDWRTSSGRCRLLQAAPRRRRTGAADGADPRRARRGGGGGPAQPQRRRDAGHLVADGLAGAQRAAAGARPGGGPVPARDPGAALGRGHPGLPDRRDRPAAGRLPAGDAARPHGGGPGLLGVSPALCCGRASIVRTPGPRVP